MSIVLMLIAFFIVPFLGVVMVKAYDQEYRDRNRQTYRLSFPVALDVEQITAWIRSVSGTLRGKTNLVGSPTIAFEMIANTSGIIHLIRVPWQYKDYIVAQLRALVPGIRISLEEEYPYQKWTTAAEVTLTHSSRQLRIYDPAATAASLLASVQALEEGEAVIMQWVMAPAVPSHPPDMQTAKSHELRMQTLINGMNATRDEINDRRHKLEQPNVLGVLRVAAVAKTQARSDHLVYRMRASLASTRGPSTRFTRRLVPKSMLQERIDKAKGPIIFPFQLSATELASLIAWPIGDPFVSGLPQALSRQLPTVDSVPTSGRIIGRSNFPGNERLVAVSHQDALKHVHVVGPTGVGKTVLLANMLKQDVEQGYGVVLLENKGDLFHAALDYIPKERWQDVVVLDVNDTEFPVGFNILQQGDPRVVVDEIGGLFDYLYKDARSVWTREVLYHALHTLVSDPRYTFVDLAPLLAPMGDEEKWSDSVRRNVRDREIRQFWQRFESQPPAARERIVAPVLDRIWQLNARAEIRNIIGQSQSSFNLTDIIKNHKILLVNLAGLPRDTATLTGTLLINALWHAAKSIQSNKPTYLYLDEFQDFMNLPVDPADMLAKARSFGLGMTLAHQHLGQLPNEMKAAVSANARTKIIFQTTNEDAKQMVREFGSTVSDHDFMSLGRYEAIARVSTGNGVSPPLTMTTLEPAAGLDSRHSVVQLSRSNHGRAVADVERSITRRRTPEEAPKSNRPAISGEGWNV